MKLQGQRRNQQNIDPIIGGSKGDGGDAPPSWYDFLHFHSKFCPNPWGWRLREKNPGAATAHESQENIIYLHQSLH